MEKFYKYAEQLIKQEKAYVCFCDKEKVRKLRNEGKVCKCREKSSIKEWKDMLKGKYKEGECTLRLKGDMESNNFVMRDPIIFRIIDYPHYRQKQKYKVWPMYDFENSIEDSITGITHILRSNEFGNMRIELQNYIKDLLGLKKQTIVQYGRFNISGAISQGREIREMIEKGEVSGWDDPQLVTLKALKRKGIVKETFWEIAKQVGLSKTPTNLDWSLINSVNRKILDDKAPRYFFIKNPVKIKIEGAEERTIELGKHPTKDLGKRVFKVGSEFIIEEEDYKQLEDGKIYRLMDCLNFKKQKNKLIFHSLSYKEFPKGALIMHWLPESKDNLNTTILMDDGSEIEGISESHLKELKEGDIVQFQRFGFCRLDSEEKMYFIFSHK
jgi:glutamyl-tRNA synthetase